MPHRTFAPSSQLMFTVIGELLLSEIVLQGAEYVEVGGCEVRAVRAMREYRPPHCFDWAQLSHVQ